MRFSKSRSDSLPAAVLCRVAVSTGRSPRRWRTAARRVARTFVVATFALQDLNSARAVTPPAIYNLGTLGGSYSAGFAVNNFGQVAGQANTPTAARAFRYTGLPGIDGAMADLSTLPGHLS